MAPRKTLTILSPNVPIFHDDYGCLLDEPLELTFSRLPLRYGNCLRSNC